MASQQGPDPALNADRGTGTTPPEQGAQSGNVVGRPDVERPKTAFHEPAETRKEEQQPLSPAQAEKEGGSFDGVAPLQDV